MKDLDDIKREARFYNKLFDSLTYSELLSLEKSNSMSRDLRRHLKIYKSFRIVKESLPLIATVGVASVIIQTIKGAVDND